MPVATGGQKILVILVILVQLEREAKGEPIAHSTLSAVRAIGSKMSGVGPGRGS